MNAFTSQWPTRSSTLYNRLYTRDYALIAQRESSAFTRRRSVVQSHLGALEMRTMQEKVKLMAGQVNENRRYGNEPSKRHHYSLLHDVVLFTGDRLDEMDPDSLAGYLELAANTMYTQDLMGLGDLRIALIELGFNTVPPGSLN